MASRFQVGLLWGITITLKIEFHGYSDKWDMEDLFAEDYLD